MRQNGVMEVKALHRKAQALLELMVFGAIVIMLLGLLINYGLRYNYQQQAMQQAFRKALVSSTQSTVKGQPKSVSHALVKDIHMPDPANPFGMGSINQVSGSASVTRDYELGKSVTTEKGVITPDDRKELPEVEIEINGKKHKFKTAGLRIEGGVLEEALEKYNFIYGSGNIDEAGEACLKYSDDDEPDLEYKDEPTCEQMALTLQILDSSDGEIIDYSAASIRCRQITDKQACETECNKNPFKDAETDCNQMCSADMRVPWYCTKLDALFNAGANKPKKMGLQDDYTQETTALNVLQKTESPSGITTIDTTNWRVDTVRKILYRPFGDTSGGTAQVEDTSRVSQNE